MIDKRKALIGRHMRTRDITISREGAEPYVIRVGFGFHGGDIGEQNDKPDVGSPVESVSEIRCELSLLRVAADDSAVWSFNWNGRSISAEMVEEAAAWVAQVSAGAISAPVTSILDVSMLEIVWLDTKGLMVGERSYRVLTVHSVKPAPPLRRVSL